MRMDERTLVTSSSSSSFAASATSIIWATARARCGGANCGIPGGIPGTPRCMGGIPVIPGIIFTPGMCGICTPGMMPGPSPGIPYACALEDCARVAPELAGGLSYHTKRPRRLSTTFTTNLPPAGSLMLKFRPWWVMSSLPTEMPAGTEVRSPFFKTMLGAALAGKSRQFQSLLLLMIWKSVVPPLTRMGRWCSTSVPSWSPSCLQIGASGLKSVWPSLLNCMSIEPSGPSWGTKRKRMVPRKSPSFAFRSPMTMLPSCCGCTSPAHSSSLLFGRVLDTRNCPSKSMEMTRGSVVSS
mmetsp:Transcript_7321/g.16518  ORF Transcript_7321/g.16518 Transcript_7321/m.16518 type:complete len:297 (-) Transcript_7321:326-1216(-)